MRIEQGAETPSRVDIVTHVDVYTLEPKYTDKVAHLLPADVLLAREVVNGLPSPSEVRDIQEEMEAVLLCHGQDITTFVYEVSITTLTPVLDIKHSQPVGF